MDRIRQRHTFALIPVLLLVLSAHAGDISGGSSPGELRILTEDALPSMLFSGPVPRSQGIVNDAELNDVCSVGETVWAVGQRGVILKSMDRGATWLSAVLPVECCLNSVSFLTDQLGFVAGAVFDSHSGRQRGLLLVTRDGGETWRPVGDTQSSEENAQSASVPRERRTTDLPPLRFVRFFDLDQAVVLGCDTVGGPCIFRTQDRGHSWHEVKATTTPERWTACAFLSAGDGILAGQGNAIGSLVSDQIVTLANSEPSLRCLHDAVIDRSGTGWLVGDAGLILKTHDGGITWKAQDSAMPADLRDLVDLRSVTHRGEVVCAVGSPGSLLFRSCDAGKSWTVAPLPGIVPVNRIRWVDAETIVTVGPLGIIQRSIDAGTTWQTVRNEGYRASILSITTDPEDISFQMLSTYAGNEGFRTVVMQPSVRMASSGIDDAATADEFSSGLQLTGSNAFRQDWMFPRTQPLHSLGRDQLLATWGRQTDGRVMNLLPLRLAAAIRTWQPDVITLERTSERDQVSELLQLALEVAIPLAGGNDQRLATLQLAGLNPWKVQRLMLRNASGTGEVTFHGNQLLGSLGTSCDLLADHCRRQALSHSVAGAADHDAEPIRQSSSYSHRSISAPPHATTHFLAGFMPAPGTQSRRLLQPIHSDQRQQLEQLLQRSELESAAIRQQARSNVTPLNLIAGLTTVGSGLPEQLQMQQLWSLAETYDAVENLDGQIAVLKEIVRRFPKSDRSAEAAERLFQFYSSAELRFLRAQDGANGSGQDSLLQTDNIELNRIQQTSAQLPGLAFAPVIGAGRGTILPRSQGSDQAAMSENMDRNADEAFQLLTQLAPDRASSPRLLLRQAATLRLRSDDVRNGTILASAAGGSGKYALLARAEMQAVHGAATTAVPIVNLQPSDRKPVLDGLLTDEIWESAPEIPLTANEPGRSGPPGLIMLGWDDDHLYVAGRFEKIEGHRYQMDSTADRYHDADHKDRDRLELMIDIDRDYSTGFHFVIDESGQTSERCWKSRRWNPDWYVAAAEDRESWRFEAAIPQTALRSRPISPGDLWAIRLQRTVPGILRQSLKPADSGQETDDTDGTGLIRFIRRQTSVK
ncbi:MAG: YCF48-related protein [Planctomycetaceae bacterium]